jgi:hypothetical protein
MASSGAASFQLAMNMVRNFVGDPRIMSRNGGGKNFLVGFVAIVGAKRNPREKSVGMFRRNRKLVSHWELLGNTELAIAQAWWDVGLPEESLAFARKIGNASARAPVLEVIARKMLQDAGAPNF